ncbi:hypothetical protein [Streptomyces capparidis]
MNWLADSVVHGPVIQGDVGSVQFGTGVPLYRMDAFPAGPAEPGAQWWRARPAQLLRAEHERVAFVGRTDQRRELAAWARSGPNASVLLLHGPGGQGKTRLAIEFARECRALGWRVLRADHGGGPVRSAGPVSGGGTERGGTPVLVVADYAERWPRGGLLAMLGDAVEQPGRARVLLVARSAGAWWRSLAAELDKACLEHRALRLAPLADGSGGAPRPEELFRAARDAFAETLGVPGALGAAPPRDLATEPGFRQVLAVHMAALAAVLHHSGPGAGAPGARPAPTRPEAVSAFLLDRELSQWEALHAGGRVASTAAELGRAVFTASLTGEVPYDTGRAALARIEACPPGHEQRALTDHSLVYPPAAPDRGGVLRPLEPDRLAEDFLALTTPGHDVGAFTPESWATSAPARLLARPGGPAEPVPALARPALTALAAAAERWPHVASRGLAPLLTAHPGLAVLAGGAALTALAELEALDPAVLEAVDADLLTAAACLARRLLPHRLAATGDPRAHAELHSRLSKRLSDAGLHADALGPAEEALALRERLAAADPAAHGPELARALDNLGHRLAHLGRWEEAGSAAERAVAVLRQLARADAAHEPRLAAALHNLGHHLWWLNRWEEALAATEEAVAVRRRQARGDPAAHQGDLAMSLHNLAALLMTVSRGRQAPRRAAEALAAAEEAVRLRGRMAADDPRAHRPALAESTGNLGVLLACASRRAEPGPGGDAAGAALAEAVRDHRELAGANARAHGPALVVSLYNLGVRHRALKEHAAAAAAFREADELRRELRDIVPHGTLPDPGPARRRYTLHLSTRAEWALTPPLLTLAWYADRDKERWLRAAGGSEGRGAGTGGVRQLPAEASAALPRGLPARVLHEALRTAHRLPNLPTVLDLAAQPAVRRVAAGAVALAVLGAGALGGDAAPRRPERAAAAPSTPAPRPNPPGEAPGDTSGPTGSPGPTEPGTGTAPPPGPSGGTDGAGGGTATGGTPTEGTVGGGTAPGGSASGAGGSPSGGAATGGAGAGGTGPGGAGQGGTGQGGAGPGGTGPGGGGGGAGSGGPGTPPAEPKWGYAVTQDAAEAPIGQETPAGPPDMEWGTWKRSADPELAARRVTVVREATGVYRVVLPGVGSDRGVPHVTVFYSPYTADTCLVHDFRRAGRDEVVRVGCHAPSGTAKNMRFHLFFGEAGGDGGPMATVRYTTGSGDADAEPLRNPGTVNTAGGAVRVRRTGVGAYLLTLDGAVFRDDGYAQLTPYGRDPARCQNAGVSGDGARLRIRVLCHAVTTDALPRPRDTRWLLTYVRHAPLPNDAGLPGAYAQTTAAAAIDHARSYSTSGGAITISRVREGGGWYRVDFRGVGKRFGSVQVVTLGTRPGYCMDQWWNSYQEPGHVWVDVFCFDSAGRYTEIPFGVAVLRAP